jgi:hypothetical protein
MSPTNPHVGLAAMPIAPEPPGARTVPIGTSASAARAAQLVTTVTWVFVELIARIVVITSATRTGIVRSSFLPHGGVITASISTWMAEQASPSPCSGVAPLVICLPSLFRSLLRPPRLWSLPTSRPLLLRFLPRLLRRSPRPRPLSLLLRCLLRLLRLRPLRPSLPRRWPLLSRPISRDFSRIRRLMPNLRRSWPISTAKGPQTCPSPLESPPTLASLPRNNGRMA